MTMGTASAVEHEWHLVGGHPALDLANTAAWDGDTPYRDSLTSYAHLLAWADHAGVIDAATHADLLVAAEHQPTSATQVWAQAVELRAVIHRLFRALAQGREPVAADVAWFNTILAATLSHAQLARGAAGFHWAWALDQQLDRPLWPLVRAAAELLASPQLARVRVCAGDRCGWLFVDTSKGGRRRWCSMADCGNRAKARQHYQRRRRAHSATSPPGSVAAAGERCHP